MIEQVKDEVGSRVLFEDDQIKIWDLQLGACPRMNDLLRTRYFGQLIRSILSNMNNYCPQSIK